MTLRVLADGAWGVHSTTDIASLADQIEPTARLAKAVAKRRSPGERPKPSQKFPSLRMRRTGAQPSMSATRNSMRKWAS